jgi:GAF domain-containing protein
VSATAANPSDTGLEVVDIESAYAARPPRTHDPAAQREGIQRIAHALVQNPESILQTLVDSAVQLCGADSAGISIQREDASETEFYHWVATAGDYSGFLNAVLPREPSACGICLQRGRPQHFRVHQSFFDILGVTAPLITDGILLPWSADGTQGTIFVMAHNRSEVFDLEDCRLMQTLADFAALAIRQQKQQKLLLERAGATAAASMANQLAHKINNPLQSLTNLLFIAAEGHPTDAQVLGRQALAELQTLSSLVSQLLALPVSPLV